ncbi:MAG: hypothetical protein Q8P18_04510 [Pseudomonadota bacterium]|nr:hypothetical protein [Pseudomonadota bacterium]
MYIDPRNPPRPGASLPTFVVSRYRWYELMLLYVGLLVVTVVCGVFFSDRLQVACDRAGVGEAARCEVVEQAGPYRIAGSFTLDEGTIGKTVRLGGSDDPDTTWLTVPAPELTRSVGDAFATRTVAEAAAFHADTTALHWEADHLAIWPAMIAGVGAVLLLLGWAFGPAHTVVELDADKPELRFASRAPLWRGAWRRLPGATVRAARAEDIDDSAFHKLLLTTSTGTVYVATGKAKDCAAAVRALNAWLRTVHENSPAEELAPEPSGDVSGAYFAGWDDLEDHAKWPRMEALLRALPVDAGKVVRRTNDRRVELRGTKAGFPVRLVFDPVHPDAATFELKVSNPLGFIDLEWDEEKSADAEPARDPTWDEGEDAEDRRTFVGPHVFLDVAEEAAAFATFPASLRKAVVDTMQRERIRYYRIRPRVTEADCERDITEYADPAAHLAAVLALLGDTARYVSSLPPAPEDEDEDEDEDGEE